MASPGYGIYTGNLGTGFGDEGGVPYAPGGQQAMGQPGQSPMQTAMGKASPYMPSIPFGPGAAPAGSSNLTGLPDWAAKFTDARRPKGAATGLEFDNEWGNYFGDLTKKYGKDFVPFAYRSGEKDSLGWDPGVANIFTPGYTLDYTAGADDWGNVSHAKKLNPITGEVMEGGGTIDMTSMQGGYLDPIYLGYTQEIAGQPRGNLSNHKDAVHKDYSGSDEYRAAQGRMNDTFYAQFLQAQKSLPTLTYQQYVDLYNKNVQSRWKEYG